MSGSLLQYGLRLSDEAPLEYVALDADAALDESPYSSHIAWQTRDNIDWMRTRRFYSSGVAYSPPTASGDTGYLSSPWPVPWGPFACYCPAGAAEVTLVVGYADVDLAGFIAGDIALFLTATSIAPDGRYVMPPRTPNAWLPIPLNTDTTLKRARIPLQGPQLSEPGWIGVLLWTWSTINQTAAASGTVTDSEPPWVIRLDTTSLTTGTPHFVLLVLDEWLGKGVSMSGELDGNIHGIGYVWQDTAGTTGTANEPEVVCVPPPFLSYPGRQIGFEWETHAIGSIGVLGVELECVPAKPRPPNRDAFAARARIASATELPLVGALNEIVRTRIPTYGGSPVVTGRTGPWFGFYLGDDQDQAAPTDTTEQAFGRALILAEPPDFNGFTAFCSFVSLAFARESSAPTLLFRLAAYTPGGSEQASQTWERYAHEWSNSQTNAGDSDEEWNGVTLNARANMRNSGAWRWLGSLMGRPDRWGAGVDLLQHVTIHWLEPGSLTYPIELRLECKFSDEVIVVGSAELEGETGIEFDPLDLGLPGVWFVAGCWFASRPRSITG